MAQGYQDKYPDLRDIQTKDLREILKIGCLAILNGGGIGNTDHLKSICENKTSESGNKLEEFSDQLSSIIKQAKISHEMKRLMKSMHNNGRCYLMNTHTMYESPDRPVNCCSATMAGGEITCLTFLIEFLSIIDIKVLPVSLEHDGVLVILREPLNKDLIKLLEAYWSLFL